MNSYRFSKGTVIELINGRWYAPAVIKDHKHTIELPGSYFKYEDTKKTAPGQDSALENEVVNFEPLYKKQETAQEAFVRMLFLETGVDVKLDETHQVSTSSITTFFLGNNSKRTKGKDMMPAGKTEWFSGSQGELVMTSLYELETLFSYILAKEKNPLVEIIFKKAELDPIFSEYVFAKSSLKSVVTEYLFVKADTDQEFAKRITQFAQKSSDFYMDNMKRMDAFLVTH